MADDRLTQPGDRDVLVELVERSWADDHDATG